MRTIEHNLSYLETSIEELEPYLLQSELFWPLSTPTGIQSDFPRLTIGTVLLVLNELKAQENRMQPVEFTKAANLQTRWEALHTKWRTAIESKSIDEMGSRLNLWKGYIQDLEENRGRQSNYDQEVRHRVRFALLRDLTGDAVLPDKLLEKMDAVDQRALALTIHAEFIWDDTLQAIYPQDKHPFLYRIPKSIK